MVHPSGLLDNLAKIMPPNQITPSVAMALMIGGLAFEERACPFLSFF
jgi:hypothetical protein